MTRGTEKYIYVNLYYNVCMHLYHIMPTGKYNPPFHVHVSTLEHGMTVREFNEAFKTRLICAELLNLSCNIMIIVMNTRAISSDAVHLTLPEGEKDD